MVRALARFDPARYADVLQWPIREGLLAMEQLLREYAETEFRAATLRYTILAQWSKDAKPPKLPAILREH